MSSTQHFNDFLTPENFHLAYQRLQTAHRNLYKELLTSVTHITQIFEKKRAIAMVLQLHDLSGRSLKICSFLCICIFNIFVICYTL
ncbi:hypothetical protein [Scytonema sp. NUACC26]|uniref:hypothetical protein n=1 Tax=Scytonema sp. NUACC26 TaxID=3140176 RepID=UPI0034DC7367